MIEVECPISIKKRDGLFNPLKLNFFRKTEV